MAALGKQPDLADQGEMRFRQMFCTTCHSLAVTRAGETKLIGGDIGPELTKVGSKVNPDWLAAWLRNPQSYLATCKMPRYQWSDEDLYKVTQYIASKLTDSDLLSDVPQMGAAGPGRNPGWPPALFRQGLRELPRHRRRRAAEGLRPRPFGAGRQNLSQLAFGDSKIPRNLIAYIQAKVTNPVSVNAAARMPLYRLAPADLDAVTTALLSMTGPPSTSGLQKLIVPRTSRSFVPPERSRESTSATNATSATSSMASAARLRPIFPIEGSRAQRKWLDRAS